MTDTVYVLVTPGDDWDLEVFSDRPTFALAEGQRLFVANVNGGDSNEIVPRDDSHAIWGIDLGDDGEVAYMEGFSRAETPADSEYRKNGEAVYGWFCIEPPSTAEARTLLLELGFTDEAIDAAIAAAKEEAA